MVVASRHLRLSSSQFQQVPEEERRSEVPFNVRLFERDNLTTEDMRDPESLACAKACHLRRGQ